MLKIEGRDVFVESDIITVRVTDCETQKAIAKAGIADCGIVTVQAYQGFIKRKLLILQKFAFLIIS